MRGSLFGVLCTIVSICLVATPTTEASFLSNIVNRALRALQSPPTASTLLEAINPLPTISDPHKDSIVTLFSGGKLTVAEHIKAALYSLTEEQLTTFSNYLEEDEYGDRIRIEFYYPNGDTPKNDFFKDGDRSLYVEHSHLLPEELRTFLLKLSNGHCQLLVENGYVASRKNISTSSRSKKPRVVHGLNHSRSLPNIMNVLKGRGFVYCQPRISRVGRVLKLFIEDNFYLQLYAVSMGLVLEDDEWEGFSEVSAQITERPKVKSNPTQALVKHNPNQTLSKSKKLDDPVTSEPVSEDPQSKYTETKQATDDKEAETNQIVTPEKQLECVVLIDEPEAIQVKDKSQEKQNDFIIDFSHLDIGGESSQNTRTNEVVEEVLSDSGEKVQGLTQLISEFIEQLEREKEASHSKLPEISTTAHQKQETSMAPEEIMQKVEEMLEQIPYKQDETFNDEGHVEGSTSKPISFEEELKIQHPEFFANGDHSPTPSPKASPKPDPIRIVFVDPEEPEKRAQNTEMPTEEQESQQQEDNQEQEEIDVLRDAFVVDRQELLNELAKGEEFEMMKQGNDSSQESQYSFDEEAQEVIDSDGPNEEAMDFEMDTFDEDIPTGTPDLQTEDFENIDKANDVLFDEELEQEWESQEPDFD